MESYSELKITSIIFVTLFMFTIGSKAQTSVKVIHKGANVYSEPNANTQLNFEAQKGDIFKLEKSNREWVQIQMFSGTKRYIKSANVEVLSKKTSDPSILSKLCIEIEEAQRKAEKQAVTKFVHSINQQSGYQRMLVDKYVLNTYRKFGVPATDTSKLLECVDDSFI